ncbi:tRNA (adenosine(37)-N6)-dimethylallyltransferase MiaA [Prochlorococcus marinus]|uniref:tRNA (adenosine(37)-N6)-dimethylallyltransferase MiaA n=1 Tax=Prochlorococcus marinus TaxID=1219 RepID=UPI0022B41EFA|nr:tRNA (adenosine(37)-N6)-dimethylallyltransferase MiaA [Prochlorococcus marinus]
MQGKKPLIIVLLGPTASGKTDLAIEIAKKIKVNIHNIDSRQLYKEMDIGTAKPTLAQQEKINHYLINLRAPNNPITLNEFKKEAEISIQKELNIKNRSFLVGGSGLYLKAIIYGLCPPSVPPQPLLREKFKNIGQLECHQILQKCDPIAGGKISQTDAIRTVRALEVFFATGKKISSLQSLKAPNWTVLELGLNPSNLHQRIAERTKNIYAKGLVEETEQLVEKYGPELPLLQTIGYKEALALIEGEYSLVEAINVTTNRTNQFAKKQRTWFRHQHNAKWLNEKNSLEEALSLIKNVIG